MMLKFPRHIFEGGGKKNLKYQIPLKSFYWESSFSKRTDRTDGRTDMTKLVIAFRNFAKAPKQFWKCNPNYYRHIFDTLTVFCWLWAQEWLQYVENKSTYTHTHARTHTLTHSHTHTLTLTHSHTHTRARTHTHAHTHNHTHTLTLTHSHSHTHIHTLTLTLTHSHSHTHTHARARAHTHTLILTHSHSHTHTHTHTHTHAQFSLNKLRNIWFNAATCFGYEPQLSSRIYDLRRRTPRVMQLFSRKL